MSASPAALAADLTAAFTAWRRRPWWAHALAVAALAAALALRFWGATWSPRPLPDELNYVLAFELAARGESPYGENAYLYPPVLALAGGRAIERLGLPPVLAAIRIANLLGLAAAVWCAMAWLGWRWRWRLLAGVLFLAAAPAVRLGYLWGNLTLAVAGMIVVGLLAWRRRPLLAGGLLGVSVVLKPLAPLAILALAAHRPAGGGRRHLAAGAAAAATAAALVLGFPHLDEWLARTGRDLVSNSLSLHRIPHLLGLAVHPLWLFSALAVATVAAVRSRPLGRGQLLAVAVAATLAATPLVWAHTLLLALPLEVLALEVARRRAGAPGPPAATAAAALRRREPLLVVLAVVGIQLSEGATALYDYPRWVQATALVPVLAPLALALYLARTTDPF